MKSISVRSLEDGNLEWHIHATLTPRQSAVQLLKAVTVIERALRSELKRVSK